MDVLLDYVAELNWLAVLLSTVAAFVVGAVWYSQGVFGKQWMRGARLTEKELKNASMPKSIIGGALSTFVGAIALAVLFDVLALDGVVDGLMLGALTAIGFVVSNKVMHTLFELKPTNYILVTTAGDIVALAVMGAVLGLIR